MYQQIIQFHEFFNIPVHGNSLKSFFYPVNKTVFASTIQSSKWDLFELGPQWLNSSFQYKKLILLLNNVKIEKKEKKSSPPVAISSGNSKLSVVRCFQK